MSAKLYQQTYDGLMLERDLAAMSGSGSQSVSGCEITAVDEPWVDATPRSIAMPTPDSDRDAGADSSCTAVLRVPSAVLMDAVD
jgi:hypothetical protein